VNYTCGASHFIFDIFLYKPVQIGDVMNTVRALLRIE